MKTFKFNDHIIEYEDDCEFDGNVFIRDILADETTKLHETESTKRCEIQTNGNVKVSEEITKQGMEATKRTDNYAAMCNSELAANIGKILITIAGAMTGGFTAYKAASSFMNQQSQTNSPTRPETPQSQPDEKKE